ncbi:MAG: YfhO family protein [Anaerolineae bacterium]|nr:YfhO family protein [Anaerolineae bacterium]
MGKKAHFLAIVFLACIVVLLARNLLLTNRILVGLDLFTYFYPYWHLAAEAIKEGRIPLWNPYIFMGSPLLANIQLSFLYGINWPFIVWLSPPHAVKLSIALHLCLAGFFTWLLARKRLGLSSSASLFSALGFSAGGFLVAQAEHINQLEVMTWLPFFILLMESNPIAAAFIFCLMTFAGHLQALYISLTAVGLYSLFSSFYNRGRSFFKLLIACGIGSGLAAVQLIPTLELAGLSIRSQGLSYQDATAFSLRPFLIAYSFLPPIALNPEVIFGSRAFTEYMAYGGIICLLLAVAGFLSPGKKKWPWVAMVFLGLFLALGRANPFYRLLYEFVPGFSSFRAPARWGLLWALGIPVLAGIGLDNLPSLSLRVYLSLLGVGFLALMPSLWLSPPPLPTLIAWGIASLVGLALILAIRARSLPSWPAIFILASELLLAAGSMPLNHPTAPQAFSTWRTAPLHLALVQEKGELFRFLSFSSLVFDPGDMAEMRSAYLGILGDKAFYEHVVAIKHKEILAPNLPALYGFQTVDGYDGGLLPLRDFVEVTKPMHYAGQKAMDGRLYQFVHSIPPDPLLDLFNVRFLIADKVYDLWVEGVYYDLSLGASLKAGEVLTVTLPEAFPATGIGFISWIEGKALEYGAPVAEVEIFPEEGQSRLYLLRAGEDTSHEFCQGEGCARLVGRMPDFSEPAMRGSGLYYSAREWGQWEKVKRVVFRGLLEEGQWHLKGSSLFNKPAGAFQPLAVSDQGPFALVHSGDVKIYENLDCLPRAMIVHGEEAVPEELENPSALEEIVRSSFNPEEKASIEHYEEERVVVRVRLTEPGYLVLTDAFYPGWEAHSLRHGPLPIRKVWGYFRAVSLPEGDDTIEFIYRPQSFRIGLVLSSVTMLALAVVIFRKASGSIQA